MASIFMLRWKFERTVQNVKPGQAVKVRVEGRLRTCFVEEVYKYFVKAYYVKQGKVIDTSITLGELVQAGYEPKGVL